jgi:hypothetical protein
MERFGQDALGFTTEEHLLSYALRRVRPVMPLNGEIERIWTAGTYRAVPPNTQDLVLWHLPAEKGHGLRTLGMLALSATDALLTLPDIEFAELVARQSAFPPAVRVAGAQTQSRRSGSGFARFCAGPNGVCSRVDHCPCCFQWLAIRAGQPGKAMTDLMRRTACRTLAASATPLPALSPRPVPTLAVLPKGTAPSALARTAALSTRLRHHLAFASPAARFKSANPHRSTFVARGSPA